MEDIKFIQTSLSQKEIQLHLKAEIQDITSIQKLKCRWYTRYSRTQNKNVSSTTVHPFTLQTRIHGHINYIII